MGFRIYESIAALVFVGGVGLVTPLNGQDNPAVGQAAPKLTQAEAKKMAAKRLMALGLGFHHYHDEHGAFPPARLLAKDGKPLLSWRVLLLPYLKEEKLFREFKLTEPWDGPHNSKLLTKMPYWPTCGLPV